MITVAHKEGFVIDHKFFYGYETPNPKYINLAPVMGEDMRYEKLDYQLIDYPGEYDINGMIIQCFLGADQKLNYVLSTGTKRIGLIQSLDVLDLSDVGVVGHWLYTDERIANKIDQMELEGEKQKLEAEEVSE